MGGGGRGSGMMSVEPNCDSCVGVIGCVGLCRG